MYYNCQIVKNGKFEIAFYFLSQKLAHLMLWYFLCGRLFDLSTLEKSIYRMDIFSQVAFLVCSLCEHSAWTFCVNILHGHSANSKKGKKGNIEISFLKE